MRISGPLAVLSGASGVEPATTDELAFLQGLGPAAGGPAIRAYGSRLGHTVEAHFPLGIALAALTLASDRLYPPCDYPACDGSGVERDLREPPGRVLVSAVGHWRGEGLALVEPVDGAREVV